MKRQSSQSAAIVASLLVLCGASWRMAAGPDSEPLAVSQIRMTLNAQESAWNRGDIPGFMDGYIRDETLRFASGGTVQRGWQKTLERYQDRYSTREQMGMLKFSELEFVVLSTEYAEVFGTFHLVRSESVGNASGLFTLLMKRVGNRWLVLHDHTSAADPVE